MSELFLSIDRRFGSPHPELNDGGGREGTAIGIDLKYAKGDDDAGIRVNEGSARVENNSEHDTWNATRAKPDIGYSLVDNDPLVTRFRFPWRWRDSVNGSFCDWLPLFPSPLSRLTLL
jgi:hypothetical protein